jgi:predicted MFS family arabinose efflux permease
MTRLDPQAASRHIRSSRLLRLRITLGTTALLDELTTGLLVVGLPLVRDTLHLSYDQAGFLFTAGALSSLLLEPGINLASDRASKRLPILLGMLCLAAAFVLAAAAPSFALLLLACGILFPANGAAVGLAQAALVDASTALTRTMTRWTIMSGIGDLLAPLAVGAGVALGLGWRELCLGAAALWLAVALVLVPQRFPRFARANVEDEPARQPLWAVIRSALRNRELLRWAAISLLATTLDEVYLAFAALYLHDQLGASQEVIGVVIALALGTGLLALVVLDRLQSRVAGLQLLPWMALTALAGVAVFLLAPSVAAAALGLALTELGAVGWYPIAKAAAYATLPGRSGLVRAIVLLGAPFETALPGATGLIAARFGLAAGLGFLALGPLAMLVLLPRHKRSPHPA